MTTRVLATGLALGMLLSGGLVWGPGEAATIDILDIGDSGAAPDGTIFVGDPTPTVPSTGTGVFEPFVRIQRSTKGGGGLENGFNTDAKEPAINFNTKDGSAWTRAVRFGELGLVTQNGSSYYVLQLDANQAGRATSAKNRITIEDMQIYIGSDPNLANPEATGTGFNGTGYTGTPFGNIATNGLLGLTPVWALDSAANGDMSILLQASIWDTPGQGGSGHGDLAVYIPSAVLSGSPTDFFVLYTEYAHANDGFEEWRFGSGGAPVPEPGTLLLLGAGLAGLGAWGRHRVKR